jgi:hypothetical protein
MARWIVAGLVVVNLLLGLGVWMRLGGERTAKADIGKPGLNFATVSGQSNNDSIIYVLEVNSGRLVALQTSIINNSVKLIAQKNVAADMQRIR